MSDPITFPSATPALGLPLLAAGQAQKEFFVNQALSMLDALQARTVAASLSAPPGMVQDGASYRVISPATGAWTGHEDHVAVRVGGDWHFVAPVEGSLLFDQVAGRMLVFRSQWRLSAAPAVPSGGTVVDVEARAAIGAVIDALRTFGVLGTPSP